MPITGKKQRDAFVELLKLRGVSDARARRFMDEFDAPLSRIYLLAKGYPDTDENLNGKNAHPWVKHHDPDNPQPDSDPFYEAVRQQLHKMGTFYDVVIRQEWKNLFPDMPAYFTMMEDGLDAAMDYAFIGLSYKNMWNGIILVRDAIIEMYEDNIRLLGDEYLNSNGIKRDLGYNEGVLRQMFTKDKLPVFDNPTNPQEPPTIPPDTVPSNSELLKLIEELQSTVDELREEIRNRKPTLPSGDYVAEVKFSIK